MAFIKFDLEVLRAHASIKAASNPATSNLLIALPPEDMIEAPGVNTEVAQKIWEEA